MRRDKDPSKTDFRNRAQPPPKACQCSCNCQPEITYVAELQPDFAGILPELSTLGELLCFGRNQHCILGHNLALPDLRRFDNRYTGSTSCVDFHLDATTWEHAYYVREHHHQRGTFTGLEFYDASHRALFRVAQTPDSEPRELTQMLDRFFHRNVPLDELGAWRRMGNLTADAQYTEACRAEFLASDTLSRPIDSTRLHALNERGYDGSLPLAYAILLDAIEEEQELAITVSGSFGRMSATLSPAVAQQISPSWIYVGGLGQSLRLNLAAVHSYWVGSCGLDHNAFSYLEALNAYGELIFRIGSASPESSRYWQSLASSMQPLSFGAA